MRVTSWKGDKLVISRRWLPWRRRSKAEKVVDAIDVVLARALFGMPWTIEVHKPWSRTLLHSEDVRGWRASGERIRALGAEYTAPDRVAPPTTASTPDPHLPELGV